MNSLQTGAQPRAPHRFDASTFSPPPVPPDSPVIDLPGGMFPPYNIERLDRDLYRIVLGVAGYGEDEIAVIEDGTDLVVRGETRALASNGETIRRLIEPRFERRFRLLQGFRLDEWEMRNGLLVIDVARDPAVPVAAELPPRRTATAAVAAA